MEKITDELHNVNLWIAILSSTVVSTIITLVAGSIRAKKDFRNQYYNTIVSKRLESLELVNLITYELSLLTNLEDKVVPRFCTKKQYYDDLMIYIGRSNALNIWLTDKMSMKITEFNVFCINNIANYIIEVENEEAMDIQYQLRGLELMEKIRNFRRELSDISDKELQTLYDVKKFLKRHKGSNDSFGVEKHLFNQ